MDVKIQGMLEDKHWYTDEDVRTLLHHYLKNENVTILNGINAYQRQGNTLAEILHARLDQDIMQVSQDAYAASTWIIPINLGQRHWAALFIHFHSQNRLKPRVGYFDPFGTGTVLTQVKQAIVRTFLEVTKDAILQSPIQLQNDNYNCGPWVVAMLIALVKSNGLRLPDDDYDIGAQQRQRKKNSQRKLSPARSSNPHNNRHQDT